MVVISYSVWLWRNVIDELALDSPSGANDFDIRSDAKSGARRKLICEGNTYEARRDLNINVNISKFRGRRHGTAIMYLGLAGMHTS
jgi:hypothetical protein